MRYRLTARMQAITQEIQSFSPRTIADIGCDHGYIPIYLLENSAVNQAFVTDISAKSLDKTVKLALSRGLENSIIPICADGISDERLTNCDCVNIAGMGGYEIINILSNAIKLPRNMVLQPNNNAIETRKFLVANGYEIIRDAIIEDKGKFYDLITCSEGKCFLSEDELVFGKTNLQNKSEQFVKFLQTKIKKMKCIISTLNENSKAYGNMKSYIVKCEALINEN